MYVLYACGFCTIGFMGSRREVLRHQRECLHNPLMKSCFTCQHYMKQTAPYFPSDDCAVKHKSFPKFYMESNRPYPIKCEGYAGIL